MGKYIKDRGNYNFPGDQEIITSIVRKHEDTISFPDEWTQSYKWLNRKGERYHIEKWTFEQDPNAKVCVFHGQSKSRRLRIKNGSKSCGNRHKCV